MASVTIENETNETSLLLLPTKDDHVVDDYPDGIQSPTIDSKRIIDIVKPDGELQTVEVPAPPGVEIIETPTPTTAVTQVSVKIIVKVLTGLFQLVPIDEVDKKQV